MSDQSRVAEFLRIHQSSQGLNSAEIEAISAVGTLREYSTGEQALKAGECVPAISLIISGLFTLSVSGESKKTFGFLGPNDQIGTLSVVQDEASTVNVVATEPSLVIEIDIDAAKELMAQNKVFARNLLSKASANMTQNAIDGGRSHRSRRVAFVHVRNTTLPIARKIQGRLCRLGERVGRIVNEQADRENNNLAHCPTLVLNESNAGDSEAVIRNQLADWAELDRIVFDIDFQHLELSADFLRGLLSFPERVYLVVEPDSAASIIATIQGVLAEQPEWSKKLNLIWVLDDQHDVAPSLPELTTLCKRVFKIKIPATNEPFFQRTSIPGIERVVHDLRGLRIGLALGGGAARGMCHLGVLKAFDECGIVIDGIAGTSVGAMMGVAYCCGYSPDDGVERFTKALTPKGIFKLLGDKMFMLYKYRSHSWDGMLRPHFYDWKLEQLLVPLTTIAADLVSAEEFVRESGDAVTGILESINLGGISVPICRDGMALVDGGYLNNVPADTLVRQGADFVISVDVTKSIKKQLGKNTPDTPTERMKAPRISQVLSRIREVTQKNLSVMGAAHADFSIAPNVGHIDFADFKSTPSTAQIGYDAAMEVMPQLLKKLNCLDPELFPADSTRTSSSVDGLSSPLIRDAG